MITTSLKLTRLINYPVATTLLIVNLTIAILWGISLLLANLGIPFLSIPLGTLVLLAPAFCLAILIEQLSESLSDPGIFFLWVVLLSYTLTPLAVWGISLGLLHQYPVNVVIVPFLLWWALCFAAASVVIFFQHQPAVFSNFSLDQKTKKELMAIVIIFLIIMVLNFTLYPLLPEADGYLYLTKWAPLRAHPNLLATESRGLFFVFVNLVSQLLKIDPYWVLKVFLPLSHFTIVLACYIYVRKFVTDKWTRIVLSLSPLFFPIILEEILISRPQSVFLIAFLPSIVILWHTMAKRQNLRQVYWLVTLLVVGAIGMKIHSLFAFIAFITLPAFIVVLWPQIKARPIDALAVAFGGLVILIPVLGQLRLFVDVRHVIRLFAEAIAHGKFDLWFIDHYRNVDGVEVGWPGISGLFYYAYNLGLFFPILFLWVLARKKFGTLKRLWRAEYLHYLFLFFFFFFVAEVAPRFGIAYLPDRAWLFLALLLTLVLPIMVSGLQPKTGPNGIKAIFVAALLSVLFGSSITYAKQGWVLPNEVEAAKFIRSNLPANALFLGQGSEKVMVRYYASRLFVRPDPPVFMNGERSDLETFLKDKKMSETTGTEVIIKRKQELSGQLRDYSKGVIRPETNEDDLKVIFNALAKIVQNQRDYLPPPPLDRETYPGSEGPIYLVYNQRKFNSLYGSRDWWRVSNFYGANLKRLSETYPVIYNKRGIIIWQVQQ